MIPLALVTGFLGSGKTSLLRHVAARDPRRLVFLVNEFAATDVDGALLRGERERVVALPGGSIFCHCLVGEFVRNLRAIADGELAGPGPPEGVIVEASGIADPAVAWRMFEETGLDERYELRSVVAVIDPGTFLRLLETLPAITAQVVACTLSILNKTDLFAEAELLAVEQRLTEIRPELDVVRAVHARVEVDLLAPTPSRAPDGEYAPCADPRYWTTVIDVPAPVDIERLRAALQGVAGDLLRAKGFVPTPTGPIHVELSSSGLLFEAAPPGVEVGQLVLIARSDLDRAARERIAGLAWW